MNNLQVINRHHVSDSHQRNFYSGHQRNLKANNIRNPFKPAPQRNLKAINFNSITQRKPIVELSTHYQRQEVENRIKKKLGNQYSQADFAEIINRANKLTTFVLADRSDLTGKQKMILKSDLQRKYPNLKTPQELQNALAGKILSLAIKTEHLFNQSQLGSNLPSHILSAKGHWKSAPFNRLLNNVIPFKTRFGMLDNRKTTHLIGIKWLGKGSFNSAHAVYDMERGEVLVYRTLQPHVMSKPQSLQQWEQETFQHYQLLQNNIPGLVEIHEIFKLSETTPNGDFTPNVRALLLEKCDGDLSALTYGKLTPQEQRSMIRQIATTIHSMHQCGLTHGDLKPQNVLYKGQETKVGDLGAIRKMGERKYVGGDRYYQPPEAYWYDVWNPVKDRGIDNFSLGLIAYELKYDQNLIPQFSEIISLCDFLNMSRRMGFHRDCFNGLRNLADPFCPQELKQQSLMQLNETGYNLNQLEDLAQQMTKNGMLNSNCPLYLLIVQYGQKAISKGFSKQSDIDTYIHNKLVKKFIYPHYVSFYQLIKNELKNSLDPIDEVILGLLEPNVYQRWTAAQVAQYLDSVA